MDMVDIMMTTAFFVTPPVLLAIALARLRAITYSTVLPWRLMVARAQYHLFYTPDYDSIASGITLATAG